MKIFIKYSPKPMAGGNGANRSTVRARINAVLAGRQIGFRRKTKGAARAVKKAPRASMNRTFYRSKQTKMTGLRRSSFLAMV